MNQRTLNFLLGIGLLLSLALNFYSITKSKKIVYVDIQKLVMKHKKMQSQLYNNKSLELTVKLRLDTLEKEIKALTKEMASPGISTERKAGLELKINKLGADKARYQQQSLRSMQESDQKRMKEMLAETNTMIKDYAERHGYQYVLGATQLGNLLYADESVDITERLLDQINK